jgi:effector-binding domain-containing protein
MIDEIRLSQVAPRSIAVVRRQAAMQQLPKVVPESCGVVWNALKAHGVRGAGRNLAVYLDDQINLEVGVEMDGPFTGVGEVVASTTPGGTVATTTHYGPYQQLGNAHRAIRDWCQQHGHRTAGPNWEIYGHWREEWNNDPSRIITDVFYLLADSGPRS